MVWMSFARYGQQCRHLAGLDARLGDIGFIPFAAGRANSIPFQAQRHRIPLVDFNKHDHDQNVDRLCL